MKAVGLMDAFKEWLWSIATPKFSGVMVSPTVTRWSISSKCFRFLSVKEAWQWKMNHLKMRLQLTKGKVEVAGFFATSFSDNFWKQETHLLMAEQKGVPLPGGECWTQHRHQQHGCHPALHLISGWVNLCSFVKEMCGVGRTFFSRAGASSVVMDGFQWTHFTMIDQKPFEYFHHQKNRMAGWPTWSICRVLQENLAPGFGRNPAVEISIQVWSCELVRWWRLPETKGCMRFMILFLRRRHWQPHPTTGKSWILERGCV